MVPSLSPIVDASSKFTWMHHHTFLFRFYSSFCSYILCFHFCWSPYPIIFWPSAWYKTSLKRACHFNHGMIAFFIHELFISYFFYPTQLMLPLILHECTASLSRLDFTHMSAHPSYVFIFAKAHFCWSPYPIVFWSSEWFKTNLKGHVIFLHGMISFFTTRAIY